MEIKVISFNIRCVDDPGGHSIAERAPRLAAVTDCYDADIIGFQEYRPAWEPWIEKYYGDRYDMFLKSRCETDKEATPILWRRDKFDCVKTGFFWLSDTPEVESGGWDEVYHCYRICVFVVLEDKQTGKRFTVMNTHFGFGDRCQSDSAKLIHDYSQKISEFPTLIIGDFNMTPDSVGYARMTESFTDVNVKTANDLRTTYHGYHPEKINNQHIDYCFVDEKITPVSQKILTDTFDGKYPSDHYGLHMVLDI